MSEASAAQSPYAETAAEIVSAYISKNHVALTDIPTLIRSVHDTLSSLNAPEVAEVSAEPLKPAVPIRKSVTDDYIISLEDGRKFKSLKRYLATSHGMTPAEYRAKWDLPPDYPMVAPAYAAKRSLLAKTIGLGRKRAPTAPEAAPAQATQTAPEPETTAPTPAPKRGRSKKAA